MDDFTKNLSENDQDSESVTENDTSSNAREISSDLIRGHINTIILRTLIDGEKYGYEIINEIEEKSHGQYTIKQPTLYSALKRLESQGYVTSYWGGVSNGGRRRYFSLTKQGREISTKNIDEWEYSRTIIDSLISDNDYDFSTPSPSSVDMRILKQSTSRVPVIHREEEKDLPENVYTPNNKVFFHIEELNELSEYADVSTSELPIELNGDNAITERNEETNEGNKNESESLNKDEISFSDEEDVSIPESSSDDDVSNDDEPHGLDYLTEDVDRITISIDDEDDLKDTNISDEEDIQNEENIIEAESEDIKNQTESPAENTKEQLPEANQAVKNYIEDTSIFTDDDYHRLALRSKIDREYKATLNRIYSSAITTENETDNGIFVDKSFDVKAPVRAQYNSSPSRYTDLSPVNSGRASEIKKIINEFPDVYQEREDIYKEAAYISTDEIPALSQKTQSYNPQSLYNQTEEKNNDYNRYDNESSYEEEKKYKKSFIDIFNIDNVSSDYKQKYSTKADYRQKITSKNEELIDFSDVRAEAKSDGIKVFTACGARKVDPLPETFFNKGSVLFKCSLITFLICLIEGIIVFSAKEQLALPAAYPAIMILMPAIITMIFLILNISKYASNVRKVSSTRCVSTAVVIFIIALMLISAITIISEVKLDNAVNLLDYVIIPSIYSFNVIIFSLLYYFLSRIKIPS